MNDSGYQFEILALVVVWSSFIFWEYYVHQWAQNIVSPIIRVDIIILVPALLLLTGLLFIRIFRKHRKNS